MRAKDLRRAVAFYRDALGLPLLFEAPPGLAFFQCGDIRLMLSKPEQAEFDHAGSILYFNVDDIEASHTTLASRGAAFREPPHVVHRDGARELWMAAFSDSEENTLAIMQWRQSAKSA
jgi:methylmalonyl-CoA/ethylmalonyl-CoA epimerase